MVDVFMTLPYNMFHHIKLRRPQKEYQKNSEEIKMSTIKDQITGLQHISLPTNNMAATLAFYQSLGFALAHEADNNGKTVCFLRLGSLCIEAYENGKAAGKAGAIDHIALDVDDIEAAWEAIRAAGYPTRETEIQALPFWDNGVRFFNIEGPNGETVEFAQIL